MKMKFFAFFFSISLAFGFFSNDASAQERIPNDTIADCSFAGGTCAIGVANCIGSQYDQIGFCNAAQTDACCKLKTQAQGQGTDYYCTTTSAGNCRQGTTCPSGTTNVGACTSQLGVSRTCCRTNPAAPTPAPGVGGPTSTTGPNFDNYTLLEQLPGSSNTVGRLNTYLEDIYRFAFWTVGIAVVFMLTIGGFMYLTSAGNTSRMESAKTVIFDAILGLVLALVAWLFLYVINPDLVNINLPGVTVTPIATPPPITTGGNNQTLAGQIQAGAPGLSLSTAGACSGASGTVSPAGSIAQSAAGTPVTACQNGCPSSGQCNGSTALNENMLRALVNVSSQYPLTVSSLTGGSHATTSAHYQGRAVDVVPSTPNKSQWPQIASAFRSQGASLVICDISVNGVTQNVSCDDPRADHIHAQW